MLTSNVLCMKKKKKRFYCVSNLSDEFRPSSINRKYKEEGGTVKMMQVTEDTPPDMLTGVMDLTIHLPNGKAVKMGVNRSTPMMDLLIQVTTAHRLQPSAHIIQALSCAPSLNHVETILPYKPNTPIGALDTQHIKVVPKFFNKTSNKASTMSSGYTQPFESTFRLQVHLPRNQLFVIRVNRYVMLEDIMKKVCSEKNLDPKKYEFRHPGNLQEVLDPKLTLSDYELTEVSVVHKGRAISASDVSALQREEERRRQQSKNGGGVFNLIFKRGKSGLGSGSISSDTRSISPTRSDDSNSRSVTPPVIQTPHILQTIQQESTYNVQPTMDKPKPPHRKRRPAPKPPSMVENSSNENDRNTEKPINQTHVTIEDIEDNVKNTQDNKNNKILGSVDNGLTICHSRNSSDSSGYHEASILSDSVNVQSLPRRNKANLTASTSNINQGETKQTTTSNTTNLKKMESHSKSTSNLTTVQRKKKAPPPPPILQGCVSVTNLSNTKSNVVAASTSPSVELVSPSEYSEYPLPSPRSIKEKKESHNPPVPKPRNRNLKNVYSKNKSYESNFQNTLPDLDESVLCESNNSTDTEVLPEETIYEQKKDNFPQTNHSTVSSFSKDNFDSVDCAPEDHTYENTIFSSDNDNSLFHFKENSESTLSNQLLIENDINIDSSNDDSLSINDFEIFENSTFKQTGTDLINTDNNLKQSFDLEILTIDNNSIDPNNDPVDTSVEIHESLDNNFVNINTTPHSIDTTNMKKWDSMENLNEEYLNSDLSTACCFNGTDDSESFKTKQLASDSTSEVNIVLSNSSDPINSQSNSKISSQTLSDQKKIFADVSISEKHEQIHNLDINKKCSNNEIMLTKKITENLSDSLCDNTEISLVNEANSTINSGSTDDSGINSDMVDTDWQYQLPSPPTAFRDSSPTNFTEVTNYNTISLVGFQSESTVVYTPELIEKLEHIRDNQEICNSEITSENNDRLNIHLAENINCVKSLKIEKDKIEVEAITDPPLGFADYEEKFSLQELEKRKSQFLEKELTSLNYSVNENKNSINEIGNGSSTKEFNKSEHTDSTLRINSFNKSDVNGTIPNFRIASYSKSKQTINIFEDEDMQTSVEQKNYETNIRRNSKTNENPEHKRISGISERELNIINTIVNPNSIEKSNLVRSNSQVTENIFKKPQPIQRSTNEHMYKNNKFNSTENISNKSITNVQRSDSLHVLKNDINSSQHNPVKRSKSHISLDMYKNEELQNEDKSVRKSSSQWNVSDLQSLQVMRSILPKLSNSETNDSAQNLTIENSSVTNESKKEEQTVVPRRYRYSPPSINLSTWSERPKSLVSLKSDEDYRTNTFRPDTNNFTYSKNKSESRSSIQEEIETEIKKSIDEVDYQKVDMKQMNKLEKIPMDNYEKSSTQENKSSVYISPPTALSVQPNPVSTEQTSLAMKLISHTTATGFKRPDNRFNMNRAPRPHSVAFDSSVGDISRVPIVRAVELKKSFRESNSGNTSIVQFRNVENENNTTESNSKCFVQTNETSRSNSAVVKDTFGNTDLQSYSSSQINSEISNKRYVDNNYNTKPSNELKRSSSSVSSGTAINYNIFNNRYSTNMKISGHQSNFANVASPVVKGFKIQPNSNNVNHINDTNVEKTTISWKDVSIMKANNNSQKINIVPKNESNGKYLKGTLISNTSVPFSQNMLRHNNSSIKYDYSNADSNLNTKIIINGVSHSSKTPKNYSNSTQPPNPPPPPLTPKVTAVTKKYIKESCQDPRDQLMDAIRNFGGKGNLKPIK